MEFIIFGFSLKIIKSITSEVPLRVNAYLDYFERKFGPRGQINDAVNLLWIDKYISGELLLQSINVSIVAFRELDICMYAILSYVDFSYREPVGFTANARKNRCVFEKSWFSIL